MAIAPTGAIYKALEFDGVSSRNYGVYITGEAVFNAPERDVEMITIPGRNGAFALDNGRFQNIEVSYPAGIFADNESDFAEAISEFRNYLCSKRGYCRLQDEYNPDEYRMAVYKSGLEVDPAQLRVGEFDIVFDCKPQRWLTSGETAITIGEWGETETATGDIVKIDNPDGTLGIKSLSVTLEPIQSGSGTPSPDNVRPISGRTEVETVVSPTTSAEDGTTYTTALGRTVYGGTLDVVSGELVVDRAMVDLGSLTWTKLNASGQGFTASIWASTSLPSHLSTTPICSAYNGVSQATSNANAYIKGNGTCCFLSVGDRRLYVRDDDHENDTAEQFKTHLSGVQLVYELAEPQTYQLTPQEVELLTGTNNVWSDSGDITLEYGQLPNLLINPTLFESGPLLEVEGIGDITFNNSVITIQAVELGAVQVYGGYTSTSTNPNHIWFDMDMSRLNIGDAITISGVQINNNLGLTSSWPTVKFDNLNITETIDIASYVKGPLGSRDSYVNYTPNNFTFYYGTAATSSTSSIKAYMSAHGPNSEGFSYTRTFTYYADYDGNEHIDIYLTYTTYSYFPQTSKAIIPAIMGDSTVSTLPTPVYIDLDIGEAYGEYSGVIASVNNAVILPAELPTLAPGSNAITFDNTITDLKVTPRWWKV